MGVGMIELHLQGRNSASINCPHFLKGGRVLLGLLLGFPFQFPFVVPQIVDVLYHPLHVREELLDKMFSLLDMRLHRPRFSRILRAVCLESSSVTLLLLGGLLADSLDDLHVFFAFPAELGGSGC